MTVVLSSQVAAHSLRVPSPSAPSLIFGRSISRFLKACGRGLSDASTAYAQAQALVFAKPGGVSLGKRRLARDADGEERDPSW